MNGSAIALGGLILTMLIQTVVIAWWASGITQMVRRHDQEILALQKESSVRGSAPTESAAGRVLIRELQILGDRVTKLELGSG